MKILNGTDIVEIYRIENDIKKLQSKFLNRIYTQKEIEYCESKNIQKYQSYAARFAAKEAIFKALSSHLNGEFSWKDFEVLNDKSGKPYIKIYKEIKNLEDIQISMSHCKEYAVANVIAVFEE